MKAHSTSAQQLLSNQAGSQMQVILRKMKTVSALNQHLQTALPAEFIGHCRALLFDKGKLTLAVSNSSLANKLRFCKSDLLEKLRTIPAFGGISTIHHVIQPVETKTSNAKKSPQPRKLSPAVLALLKQMSEETQEPALRQTFQDFLTHQSNVHR